MTNDVIDAIAKAIKTQWEENCDIYINQLRQGFNTPCFFIELIEAHTEAGLSFDSRGRGGRYHDELTFQISYFPGNAPGDGGDVRKMYNIIPKMGLLLELLTLADGTKIRGRDISNTIDDDVLHATVIYDVFYYRVCDNAPYMETLKQTQTTTKTEV